MSREGKFKRRMLKILVLTYIAIAPMYIALSGFHCDVRQNQQS